MSNSKLTLLIDGNWLLMSRLSVLQNRYSDDDKLAKDLKLMMVRSINIVLKTFPEIDNVIFVSDGGSWRNKLEIPAFLQEEYKGNRVKSEEIDWDLVFGAYEDLLSKLKMAGITTCKEPNLEGDDWMWYWSTKLNSEGTNVIIWSRDKDLTQLVNVDKDCCFTVCWNKDGGVTTVPKNMDDMDFFFNETYSVNEYLYSSVLEHGGNKKEINPKLVVMDKIVRGDAGDNILPIILKPSKTNKDKMFRVASADINPDVDYDSDEEITNYINGLLESKSYKGKITKPVENIIEHFKYNKRLVALEKSSYPPEILKIFDDYQDYTVCKDTKTVEYQLIAESNQVNSILDFI